MRIPRPTTTGLLLASLFLASTTWGQLPNLDLPDWSLEPGRLVDVGGYSLNVYCFGEGEPTVVLEAGGGWGAAAWFEVQPRLAQTTRVCSYDRAGMGFSDTGPADGGFESQLDDLERLLAKSGERPPYVLVGWSLGGMLVRGFAWRHPDQVAGLVTVDGSDFDWNEAVGQEDWRRRAIERLRGCHEAAKSGLFERDDSKLRACAGMIDALQYKTEMREAIGDRVEDPARYARQLYSLEHGKEEAEALRALHHSFGDLPLRVLVAGEHFVAQGKDPSAANDLVNRPFVLNAYKVASLSTDGVVIVVPGAGHGIHLDRPDVVIEVIRRLVEDVRASPGSSGR